MKLPAHVRAEVQRILDGDPAKLLGVRRSGFGVRPYCRLLQNDPCAYCGRARRTGYPREIDHIVARARGGENRWWNYTGACSFCNVLKYDTSMLDYLLRLQRLPDDLDAILAERGWL